MIFDNVKREEMKKLQESLFLVYIVISVSIEFMELPRFVCYLD